jgi:hypothetical protein
LLSHTPFELQVSGCDPLHVVVLGTQLPAHTPAVQTYGHTAHVLPHAFGFV